MPDGTFSYTRDGSFMLDGTGRLVTPQRFLVQPGITVPQNATGFSVNVTEISDLIAAQRAYEMNAKVITAADQMLAAVIALQR
jgi:flagellar basal body rod protein FlgG